MGGGNRLIAGVVVLALSGCTLSAAQTSQLGALAGAGIGALIGVATGGAAAGALLGAGAGTIAGGLAGQELQRRLENQEQEKFLADVEASRDHVAATADVATAGSGSTIPRRWIDTSRRQRVWVEDRVVEGTLQPAHFEERLVPSGYWEEGHGPMPDGDRGPDSGG